MSDLPGYDDWKTTPPPEETPDCECGELDCEDCERLRQREDAYWRHIDQQIDERRGK